MSNPPHPSGTSTPSSDCVRARFRSRLAITGSWELEATPRAARGEERASRQLDILGGARRLPRPVPLCGKEREAYASPDANDLGQVEEAPNHADLVPELRASENRDQGAHRSVHDCIERVNLSLHQTTRGGCETLGNARCAGVRLVCARKRIVYVEIRQLRQGCRQRRRRRPAARI